MPTNQYDVEIELVHDVRNVGTAGTRHTMNASDAKLLVRGGLARAATVPEAKKLGDDPSTAATKQKG